MAARRDFTQLTRGLMTRPPAQLDALYALARARGLTLPGDYVEFMSASDGGEGDVGNGYVELWPVHKTLEVADRYSVYEDFLAFAGDGKNTIYGFDLRASGEAVEGDWIGLERHELIRHGRTLTELLRAVATT